jgi:PLD-like domain
VKLQSPANKNCVADAIASLLATPDVERIRVAVAYANKPGVQALLSLLRTAPGSPSVQIVLTTDMGITRKDALAILLRELPESVRLISSSGGAWTFHTKAIVIDIPGGARRALVGSANLTGAALTENYEGVTVTDLTLDDAQGWESWWDALHTAAVPLTRELIDEYTERRPPPGRRERIADEDISIAADGKRIPTTDGVDNAQDAEWLAIDWGGTGEYRVQAEFPAAAAAFFHAQRGLSRTVVLRYAGVDYGDNQLTFYPDNGMARVNLDKAIPVVADESIRTSCSLFSRLGDDHYELTLLETRQRATRLAEASARGGRGFTSRHDQSRREFGWA